MSRISFASHPFLLGFEELDRLVERTAKAGSDGYPPYNIEQRGQDAYRITLAVAGFAEADLAITLEDGHLVVRGKQPAEEGEFERLVNSRGKIDRGDPQTPFTGREADELSMGSAEEPKTFESSGVFP